MQLAKRGEGKKETLVTYVVMVRKLYDESKSECFANAVNGIVGPACDCC